jgi:uncharacterized cupin superfamily protein
VKVQQLKQAAIVTGLNDWGTTGLPGTDQVRVSGARYVIPGNESIDTGVFECSVGTYRRSVKQAEVMHFICGAGTFTADGEPTIHFKSGDTLFFEANTEGLWDVQETMRKIYVIF